MEEVPPCLSLLQHPELRITFQVVDLQRPWQLHPGLGLVLCSQIFYVLNLAALLAFALYARSHTRVPVVKPEEMPGASLMVLGLVLFLDVFCTDQYQPTMPAMAREFGVSMTAMGYSIQVQTFSCGVGTLLTWAMSEYLGRRPMILALQATLAVSSFTCAMAPTFTWLLLGRALQGLGASGLGVALASVHDCYEASHHKYNANGTLFSFMLLGPVVAPAVGGVLAVHGWRVSFLLVASLASMLFVVSLWAVPETAGLPSASCADTTRSLTSAHRCSLLLCMGMVKCFYDVLASGNSSVLEVNFGFSVAGAAAVSSSLAVCAAWAIALPTFLGGKPVSLMQRFLLLSCASGAFMACCGKFFSGNVEAYIFSIILALLAISPIAAECGRLFMQEVNDMAGVAGTLQYAVISMASSFLAIPGVYAGGNGPASLLFAQASLVLAVAAVAYFACSGYVESEAACG